MERTDIAITIGTAVFSFVGALAGVYAGSKFDQENWEARFELEQRKTILERRTALIEKTVSLFNRGPTIQGLRASLDAEKQLAKISLDCARAKILVVHKKQLDCKLDHKFDPERIERLAKEIHTLNAEYSSTMTLASIYFGEKTKAAITDLDSDPWISSPAKNQRLIDAMGQDLNYFPK